MPKSQVISKPQITKEQKGTPLTAPGWEFNNWDLPGIWSLGFGISGGIA
jgi:hypothetical protein